MKIIDKKINEINPYKNNPRNNGDAVEKVAASIKEFGFKVPIVIDKNNVVVTGHTRLKAAQVLGLDSVPVIIADDLTPEQIKAFRLVDNKTAEFAKWDMELLESELCDIDIDVDMADFGFTRDAAEINLDDFKDRDISDKKTCQCPKCGFEWCEK